MQHFKVGHTKNFHFTDMSAKWKLVNYQQSVECVSRLRLHNMLSYKINVALFSDLCIIDFRKQNAAVVKC
jgi:hypothetical protein